MRNLPMPIRVPEDYRLHVTQHYANSTNNEWYHKNGINIPFHNGADIVLRDKLGRENRAVTYGAPLITPSNGWRIVKVTFDSPMSTKGNGVTIESPEFIEDGKTKKCQVVLWHCSEVRNTPGELPAYTEVAYIGNSGLVSPAPTPYCVHCGAHLHLMLFEYTKQPQGYYTLDNADNGVGGAVDPFTRFNISNVIYGEDSSVEKDLPPFQHFIAQIMAKLGFV